MDKQAADKAFKELFEDKQNIKHRSKGFFTGVNFVESLYQDFHGIQGRHTKLQFLDNLRKIVPLKALRDRIDRAADNLSLDETIRKSKAKDFYQDNYFTCKDGELVGDGILGKMFPNITFEDFVSTLESSSRKDFFLNLQNKSCDDKGKFDYKIRHNVAFGHSADRFLDEALEKGKIANIEYNADIFDSLVTTTPVLNFSNHVSTIVARRWNATTETCEYQLKNSWGQHETQKLHTPI